MNWGHVHLIFKRELSDQLRDRRTLFTITVLPILLYPLLGMLMLQIAQFNQEHSVRVRVVGAENWPAESPLLTKAKELAVQTINPRMHHLVEFDVVGWEGTDGELTYEQYIDRLKTQAREAIRSDAVDAVLIVEPDFQERLQSLVAADQTTKSSESDASLSAQPRDGPGNAEVAQTDTQNTTEAGTAVPASGDGLHLIANLARSHSQIAHQRLNQILRQWKEDWSASQLANAGMNPQLVAPLQLAQTDTAKASVKKAMLWSKVLPFVMLVWALTGAFYPAIDLCAGEKERGTLETLLSSPARRREIVWGKLLTISVFSIGSALLNLFSMHMTASLIVRQLANQGGEQLATALGPMPIQALGWLVLLLLPMSAFFSALALAVAALARSTKEGQYYLMPLLLVTLPLVALPMLPSLQLSLGTSLIPISGAVFLIRAFIEGNYSEAMMHLPVVILVTLGCCMLSLRWAVRQFESESVMFRESERWNFRLWMHQLWRDRGDTASPTEAVLCGFIIIVAMFFAQMVAPASKIDWSFIAKSTIAVQLAIMLAPSLLMAIFLTRSLRRALRIHRVQPAHLLSAIALGFAMHPSYMALGKAISSVYTISDEMQLALSQSQAVMLAQPLWALILLLACVPAVCEELTFRGFIFGGLLRHGGALRAVVVSALFFGFAHTVLQQSLAACVMGLILGLIAWRTGGVICTMFVHLINNTLSLTLAWCGAHSVQLNSGLTWAIDADSTGWSYTGEWMTMSIALSLALLFILFRRDATTERVVTAEMV
ncbi:MAG: ABC transporter permease subunit [Aureliella sp.]